jgi:hypothetical protein
MWSKAALAVRCNALLGGTLRLLSSRARADDTEVLQSFDLFRCLEDAQ